MFSVKANYNGPYSITTSVESHSYTIKIGQHIVIKDSCRTSKSDIVSQKKKVIKQK